LAQQELIAFFQLIASKNSALLAKLSVYQDFIVEEHSWEFTLPSLHSFLQSHDNTFTDINYTQFRTLLFSSPINLELKNLGAKINISDNQKKVDKSRYTLVWNNP